MGKLIYGSNCSLDGFTEDADGGFNWAPPDDDVFAFTTDLMAEPSTYLYGRRMYEVMSPWETDPALGEGSDLRARFAQVWQGPEKVVYSTTLTEPLTAKTSVEPVFDLDGLRARKEASDAPTLIGGPHLAAQALRAGLVDDVWLLVWPQAIGGRNPALPSDWRADLELVNEHRFANGVVHLRYRVR